MRVSYSPLLWYCSINRSFKVLDVLEFDDHIPIIIVVFQHDVEGSLSQGSFDWIFSYAFAPQGPWTVPAR
jgi:hypothetical protein